MENHILMQSLRMAFVFCLYFLTLACYLTPILVIKYWSSQAQIITSPSRAVRNRQYFYRVVSWCNCTATGIFLAMCFLALFPYVQEMFHSIFKKAEYDVKFPVTECIIVLGFILTLLLQQSLLMWQEQRDVSAHDDLEQNQGLLEECEMQDLSDDPSGLREDHEQGLVNSVHHSKCSGKSDPSAGVISISSNANNDHGHNHFSLLLYTNNGFPFFILAVATGLHSIFEGITLGLQTNITKAVHLFIAIIIHECLVAAALGISSTRLKYSFMSYLKFSIVFSAGIPAGILIGVIIEHTPGTVGEITSAILQGLAAGIFLHVTFQDFLPSEFSNQQDRILKVFFVVLGFIIIAVVTYFIS